MEDPEIPLPMEDPEVPLETIHEEIHHHAEHAIEPWVLWVALSSALIAAMAAIASLMAGHHANEAVLDQLASSDQWGYYQAKGVKSAVLSSKSELLQALGHTPQSGDAEKLKRYEEEQNEIKNAAQEKQAGAALHLTSHTIFARSVTMFQVAIAISAISVLVRRRLFWFISLGFAAVGVYLLAQGFTASGQLF
jgi:Domain of unknown function (DUF4337)